MHKLFKENYITETGVMFISLAVSGVIYRFLGSDILFSFNAISFLISAICFYKIRYKGNVRVEDDDKLVVFDKQVIEIIKKEKNILDIMLVSMLFSVICRIYNILIADLILISLLISIQGICFKNILQENVENRYLGRIFATYKIIITISSLITVAIIPFISDKVSVVTIFLAAGAMLLISCIYFMLKKGDLLLHN